MIHTEELPPDAHEVKARDPRRRGPVRARSVLALLLPLLGAGCESDPVEPAELRFGQVGEIQVDIQSPVAGGSGLLDEALLWRSDGPWVLVERLSYEGRSGDESVRHPTLNPGELAAEYASLLKELNESPGLRLFVPEVSQEPNPSCGERSRIRVTIRDYPRGEEAVWRRCVEGTFFTATPGTAGPDAGAARVVTAAQLVRFFTLGEEARSSYLGSLPFATLDRGEAFGLAWDEPRLFRSQGGAVPSGWDAFWDEHAGPDAPDPGIDWASEMVVVAAIGQRDEAGESLRIRRILPVEGGTRVELVRRVPGDFCSPAARETHPFHLVVAPRTAGPIFFNEPVVERIPCG